MSGVSQSALTWSASAVWPRAASPLIRTTRRSPSGSRPVPMSTGPAGVSTVAATPHPGSSPWRSISASLARRNPRPGASSETASRRLVLPAPFGPTSTTGRASGVSRAVA